MIGQLFVVAFTVVRFAALAWAVRGVVTERFVLGMATIGVRGALAVVFLVPAITMLVPWPAAFVALFLALDAAPLIVAWRREHHAAQGSEDEARAGRIVSDVLPLSLLDAGNLVVELLAAWVAADRLGG